MIWASNINAISLYLKYKSGRSHVDVMAWTPFFLALLVFCWRNQWFPVDSIQQGSVMQSFDGFVIVRLYLRLRKQQNGRQNEKHERICDVTTGIVVRFIMYNSFVTRNYWIVKNLFNADDASLPLDFAPFNLMVWSWIRIIISEMLQVSSHIYFLLHNQYDLTSSLFAA